MLADKTEKYWCVNIFFIGLKPPFFGTFARPTEKIELLQELYKKNCYFRRNFNLLY